MKPKIIASYGERSDSRRFVPWPGETGWKPILHLSEKMTSGWFESLITTEFKHKSGSIDRLTDRELKVLDLIGRGRTTREIADSLQVDIATVDTYRAKLKEKMNLRNATESLGSRRS